RERSGSAVDNELAAIGREAADDAADGSAWRRRRGTSSRLAWPWLRRAAPDAAPGCAPPPPGPPPPTPPGPPPPPAALPPALGGAVRAGAARRSAIRHLVDAARLVAIAAAHPGSGPAADSDSGLPRPDRHRGIRVRARAAVAPYRRGQTGRAGLRRRRPPAA